jgi:transcriptional regulator GlxA family with amidase domain
MKNNEIGFSPATRNAADFHVKKSGKKNHFENGGESECGRRITRSIEHMLQNLDKPLSVAKLAATANISESHYFAMFKRCTGGAPIDYFIRLRMQKACRLLGTTSMSVKEVAAILGYDDPFYFSRVFKLINRIAPSQYRVTKEPQQEKISI